MNKDIFIAGDKETTYIPFHQAQDLSFYQDNCKSLIKSDSFYEELVAPYTDRICIMENNEIGYDNGDQFYYYHNGCILFAQLLLRTTNIQHEMAHFIDLGKVSRIRKPDFGFWLASKGRFSERQFLQAMVRETRVQAIQDVIQETVVYDHDKVANSRFIHNGVGPRVYSNWDHELTYPLGKLRDRCDVRSWTEKVYDTAIKYYTKGRVRREWHEVMEYLFKGDI